MPTTVPQEFYHAVDRFVNLANELAGGESISRISSVILFAAARYNAHCMMALDPEAAKNVDAAIDYFVNEYRAMLKDNVRQLLRDQASE